jgi:Leucine-rich repeat (LRR) protein
MISRRDMKLLKKIKNYLLLSKGIDVSLEDMQVVGEDLLIYNLGKIFNYKDYSDLSELRIEDSPFIDVNGKIDLSFLKKFDYIREIHLEDSPIKDISDMLHLKSIRYLTLTYCKNIKKEQIDEIHEKYKCYIFSDYGIYEKDKYRGFQSKRKRTQEEIFSWLKEQGLDKNDLLTHKGICVAYLAVKGKSTFNSYLYDDEKFEYESMLSSNDEGFKDFSFFKDLYLLEDLDLYLNDIEDISDVVGLTNLKRLNLANNNIKDIRPLYGLINLEELKLTGNNIPKDQILELKQRLPNCKVIA